MDTTTVHIARMNSSSEARKRAGVLNFRDCAHQILGNIRLQDLPLPTKHVVSVSSNETLLQAFEKLQKNQIHSAPVERTNGGGYVGLIETRDLVRAVVSMHANKPKSSYPVIKLTDCVSELGNIITSTPTSLTQTPTTSTTTAATTTTTPHETTTTNHFHTNSKLDALTPGIFARKHPIKQVPSSTTLLDVCRILALGDERVVEVNNDQLVRVVSRSWVAHAINDLLGDIDGKIGSVPSSALPISEFGIVPKEVKGCFLTAPAISAFQAMVEHDISSIPILDQHTHTLHGFVSASTLSQLLRKNENFLSLLDQPLQTLLDSLGEKERERAGGMGLLVSATVGEMFESFVEKRTHRLFLVDSGNVVVGVCSLKDVLRALF